ncbi:unnamed protein product [Sphagnum jensenii]|uniref:Uncharacterized protein n=1 Tax=Sphagnum jensenii TaxID=128206 RepID=A0ABP1B0H0_9BRYO
METVAKKKKKKKKKQQKKKARGRDEARGEEGPRTRPEKGPGSTRARQASGQEAAGTRESKQRGNAGRPAYHM